MFLIDTAHAQGTSAGGDPLTGLLVPMLLMMAIFYFLVIRPQSERAKKHREMIEKVRRGDTVVTSGGFVGKVRRDRGRAFGADEGARLEEHADGRPLEGRAGEGRGLRRRTASATAEPGASGPSARVPGTREPSARRHP